MKIQIDQIYCTRDGRQVLILDNRGDADYPIRGVNYDNAAERFSWTTTGVTERGIESPSDILSKL